MTTFNPVVEQQNAMLNPNVTAVTKRRPVEQRLFEFKRGRFNLTSWESRDDIQVCGVLRSTVCVHLET